MKNLFSLIIFSLAIISSCYDSAHAQSAPDKQQIKAVKLTKIRALEAEAPTEQEVAFAVAAKWANEADVMLVDKPHWQNARNLLDSLHAVSQSILDEETQQTLSHAILTIRNIPKDSNPQSWLNWANAVIVALTALVTLLLAKGKRIKQAFNF